MCLSYINPNSGWQSNWRWYARSKSDNETVHDTKSNEEAVRVRRNPDFGWGSNWRWYARSRIDNGTINGTEFDEEDKVRTRRNPNFGWVPNWRWIAYPRSHTDNGTTNGTESDEEGKVRTRRNPNTDWVVRNWRWIVYPRPRTHNSTMDDAETKSEKGNVRTIRDASVVPEKVKTHKHHHHSRSKLYDNDQEKQNSSFNRSLYEGWYQTPSSLKLNNTLRFGGPWGSSQQEKNDDTVNTCDTTEIPICNDDNNVPGEIRQCFSNSDAITSFAMNVFNVTADNIQILKEDQKVTALPFPDEFNVTISEISRINGCNGNPLVCHSMTTNSSECDTIYLCHSVKGTIVEEVIVDYNEEVNRVKMYAMCHMDTKDFGKDHIAFRMLNKHPGDSICHFISFNSFLVCIT